jgi:hypothetical protein
MTDDGMTARAKALLESALVWDAHSGFAPTLEVDLNELERWRAGSVDLLSINVGFDAYPWEDTIRNLAAFRHWLAFRPEQFVLIETAEDCGGPRSRARWRLPSTSRARSRWTEGWPCCRCTNGSASADAFRLQPEQRRGRRLPR